ncbi:hypothetical protein OHA45_07110 [Streptomyces lydicus]|uniref:hypothetical protein n=1 Tax=Streptomyces lydicus TaxID=47763 RepID=UPI002E31D564|nr:hypothetical protein [Streptomyces lydicus]
MLIVDAVVETVATADFSLWPVAPPPPDRLLALSHRMSPAEVGTALATLVDYNSRPSTDERPVADAGEQLRRLLQQEKLIAPGGLRLRETDIDVTVRPGCCCGLEDWRDWLGLLEEDVPWLGHDPSPAIEVVEQVVRLWPDGGTEEGAASGPCLEIPVGDLARILHTVHDELQGFLSLTGQWAACHVPSLATDLVTRLGEDPAIGAPLPGGGDPRLP